MTISFEASQSGTLEIDEATGMIEDGELEQKLQGVFRVDSLPGMDPPEETPFAISGSFKIRLEESSNERYLEMEKRKKMRNADSLKAEPDK